MSDDLDYEYAAEEVDARVIRYRRHRAVRGSYDGPLTERENGGGDWMEVPPDYWPEGRSR
jgi:hypothetical protein